MPATRLITALFVVLLLVGCGGDTDRETSSTRASVSQAARLDTTRIPVELRPLTALAAEWGIGDDDERAQKVEQSSAEQRQALRSAVLPHDQRITEWLDSFGQGSAMTDEAAAFMYMRLAIEEMPDAG
jgi:Tfp pilus assembly protein PilP